VNRAPIEILVLATFLEREQAGAAQATMTLINALAKEPWARVRVFAYRADPSLLDPAARIIRGPEPRQLRFLWRVQSILALAEARRTLRNANLGTPDMVYTQSTLLGLAWRQHKRRIPLISHTGAVITKREILDEDRGMPMLYRRLAAATYDRWERQLYRERGVVNIVSTPLVARQREEHFGLPPGFFHVSPYGIDPRRFSRNVVTRDVRTELGIPSESVVVMTLARLLRWKNISWVVESMARLSDNAHLIVAGDGPEAPTLRQQAAASPAGQRIHFVGHVDPPPYLAAADIFALPSSIESFGIVYAEAMLSGLPCIGLRNDPPRVLSSASDVIPEEIAGYTVSTVDELGTRLRQLEGDAVARRQMGTRAREHAQQHYTTARYVEDLKRLATETFALSITA
jgi:glycosyltransferase involved in cell wall biosynthesis